MDHSRDNRAGAPGRGHRHPLGTVPTSPRASIDNNQACRRTAAGISDGGGVAVGQPAKPRPTARSTLVVRRCLQQRDPRPASSPTGTRPTAYRSRARRSPTNNAGSQAGTGVFVNELRNVSASARSSPTTRRRHAVRTAASSSLHGGGNVENSEHVRLRGQTSTTERRPPARSLLFSAGELRDAGPPLPATSPASTYTDRILRDGHARRPRDLRRPQGLGCDSGA